MLNTLGLALASSHKSHCSMAACLDETGVLEMAKRGIEGRSVCLLYHRPRKIVSVIVPYGVVSSPARSYFLGPDKTHGRDRRKPGGWITRGGIIGVLDTQRWH